MPQNGDLGSGLLSDLEILERIVSDDPKRAVFISPMINLAEQLGPSSLDLRMGTELTVTRTISEKAIDLSAPKDELEAQKKRYAEVRLYEPGQPFVLHPGEFVLANTLEYIKLPPTLGGRLEGRSSLGRLGIQVHATAGFVDPGFEGTLTWELTNCGRLPVALSPGIRLGQMCFLPVTEVQVDYMSKRYSKYGKQVGLEFSRIELDPDRMLKRQ